MSDARDMRLIEHAMDQLEREREALVEGRWADLTDSAEGRARDLARLGEITPKAELAPHLARLRASAARNAALCRKALEGFAAGRRRVAEIMEAGTALRGYDASGAPVVRAAPAGGGRRA
jgi:hypothetical protein